MKEPVFVTTDSFIEGGTVPTPKLFYKAEDVYFNKSKPDIQLLSKCI